MNSTWQICIKVLTDKQNLLQSTCIIIYFDELFFTFPETWDTYIQLENNELSCIYNKVKKLTKKYITFLMNTNVSEMYMCYRLFSPSIKARVREMLRRRIESCEFTLFKLSGDAGSIRLDFVGLKSFSSRTFSWSSLRRADVAHFTSWPALSSISNWPSDNTDTSTELSDWLSPLSVVWLSVFDVTSSFDVDFWIISAQRWTLRKLLSSWPGKQKQIFEKNLPTSTQ